MDGDSKISTRKTSIEREETVQNILEAHLPPIPPNSELEEALNTLAEVVHILDIPDASFSSYSTAITRMSDRRFELSRSLNRLAQVETELKEHFASLKHEFDLLQHWNDALDPNSPHSIHPESAMMLERRKASVVRKAKEYHRELEILLGSQPLEVPVTLPHYLAQKEKNLQLEKSLKEKRAKIKAFQGLSPNLELARHELHLAREKQKGLFQLRERLLGKMAEGVA
ncbi:hypothetical protein CVT24_000677 [Panaeolus cyanescens]|uniref:Uncharacterized protein n=1 Tax=Panaeolus cyanescens TaxID=181874 RepID=A0A409VWI9_9AGAR|nr:hypothetical protein CVT24_000677 [Panaeolus cyanescens]